MLWADAGIRQLREIDLFAGVPDAELEQLAAALTTIRYPAGAEVMTLESPDRVVYVVASGLIRLFRRGPDGREVTIATLGRGRIFGIEALFGPDGVSELRAEAATPTVVCRSSGPDFRRFIERHPAVMVGLMRDIVARLLEAEDYRDQLTAGGSRVHLANALVRLVHANGGPSADGSLQIEVAPTHVQLARHIGVSRETVTRLLATFEAEGLIRRSGRRVVIVDPERLIGSHPAPTGVPRRSKPPHPHA